MYKYHTCGKQHFVHQTGPEQRYHYEIRTGSIGITLRVFFILPRIRKSDNLTVFHKYDVVFDNVRCQKHVPNHFNQSAMTCVVWYGMGWCGMVWCCVVWCGMVWYGVVWYGMVWYGMVWNGMVLYGMAWYGMVLYGMEWYGMVWYGMVWYGMVWEGIVWYCTAWYGGYGMV